MDRIWNAASEESIVECFKKANCMPIIVIEETESVPAAAKPDAFNIYALDDDIKMPLGALGLN